MNAKELIHIHELAESISADPEASDRELNASAVIFQLTGLIDQLKNPTVVLNFRKGELICPACDEGPLLLQHECKNCRTVMIGPTLSAYNKAMIAKADGGKE